jgi:hypothetical protein
VGSTSEALVRHNVKSWAKGRGIRHVRLSMMRGVRVGIPDDMFLIPPELTNLAFGVPVLVEFKAPKKKPTELQTQRLMELRRDGFFATWFNDADAATTFLENVVGALAVYAKSGRPFDIALLRGASAEAWGAQNEHNLGGVLRTKIPRTGRNHARDRSAPRRAPNVA